MPKAILVFDLSDADESRAFALSNDAFDMQLALWDFYQDVLRQYYKHGIPESIKTPGELLELIRERFLEILDGYELRKYI